MAFDGFTIRIYVPDGVRFIDRVASTELAISFPRAQWPRIKSRPEFERAGIYVLSGYAAEDADLPTLYIGQGDSVLDRIDSHFEKKVFYPSDKTLYTDSNRPIRFLREHEDDLSRTHRPRPKHGALLSAVSRADAVR